MKQFHLSYFYHCYKKSLNEYDGNVNGNLPPMGKSKSNIQPFGKNEFQIIIFLIEN